jgi:hypothetical protein
MSQEPAALANVSQTSHPQGFVLALNDGSSSLKFALFGGGGSIGIIGAARVGILVAKHPVDESQRIIAVIKCNVAAVPPPTIQLLHRGGGGGLAVGGPGGVLGG